MHLQLKALYQSCLYRAYCRSSFLEFLSFNTTELLRSRRNGYFDDERERCYNKTSNEIYTAHGATGFVGRFLLRDLILSQCPVVVLARGLDAEKRVQNVLSQIRKVSAYAGIEIPTAPVTCITADLSKPGLELLQSDLNWLKHNVGNVVHCAGDVSFQGTDRDNGPWLTNVHGTQHLADICNWIEVPKFSYVSTAFVCGDRNERVLESDLDCGQSFQSDYEQSKFEAEKLLYQYGFECLNIFRPCFIGGDSLSGYTSSFHGIYWFAQFTSLLRKNAGVEPGEPWELPYGCSKRATNCTISFQ